MIESIPIIEREKRMMQEIVKKHRLLLQTPVQHIILGWMMEEKCECCDMLMPAFMQSHWFGTN